MKMAYFFIDEIKPLETGKSIATITRSNPIAKKVSDIIKTYSEEDLLRPAGEKSSPFYFELKKHILDIGNDVELRPTKSI